jgi:two-component system alkaline phosphatase synthesis response regulator PhoP
MNERILIVEDDASLVRILSDRLKKEGYQVTAARDGTAGYRQAVEQAVELIILDLMLPGESGLEVCRKLRQEGLTTPILMLTAKRQTLDKVVGLKTGGDDYLTKPFVMDELLARVEALLRRASRTKEVAGNVHQFGAVKVDLRRTEVTRDGQPVPLSAKEFQLLQYFIEHPGETLSRDELLRKVWGYEAMPNTRTVDVHVAWLRQKLETDPKRPQLILTAVGLGYKFIG